ncbi:hypothetical protein PFISCL1PPCAC_11461, partial [Pristionchus fissidentatus]
TCDWIHSEWSIGNGGEKRVGETTVLSSILISACHDIEWFIDRVIFSHSHSHRISREHGRIVVVVLDLDKNLRERAFSTVQRCLKIK